MVLSEVFTESHPIISFALQIMLMMGSNPLRPLPRPNSFYHAQEKCITYFILIATVGLSVPHATDYTTLTLIKGDILTIKMELVFQSY